MATAATPFTLPTSCSTSWVAADRAVSVGVQCLSGSLVDDGNCFPSTMSACPVNWKVVRTGNSITTCCPGEFDLAPVAGHCYSTAGGSVLSGITCAPSDPATAVTAIYGFVPGVWALAVSYVGTTTSSSVTSSATPGSVASTAPPSPSATTSLPSPPPSNPTLSAGAIAGIVVGSLLAVALIFASLVLLKKRHGKPKNAPEHQPLSHPPDTYHNTKMELDATQPSMLYSPPNPIELESHEHTPHIDYK